ncbi:hypothetical protein CHUAL_011880 [Chamberlinius hualienensis]
MRSRSNSGVRLDYYQRVVSKTILQHQDPVTGLLPSTPGTDHAWVRDNVYSIMAVWALALAYKKNADLDEDRAKAYEMEQSCVKNMRGLLMAMMRQKDKVEKFKETLSTKDSLHAKYSTTTGRSVVGNNDWGHLQIDATALYLLTLAQMTASGLQIVFNLDEVAFVQNLVFYIESAYCIPDYGIWERGDKTNHGLPELNASSIGMAKAALEAMNELDLFGARGGPASVIHVMADEAQKCEAVLQSMLPRESNSKEIDAALLSIISFPAFAVSDIELVRKTRTAIIDQLQGRYGCKRFLRDGHKTAKEDKNRLYYEPWELKVFENIECEWPLFFCYLILDGCFMGNIETVDIYQQKLEELLIKTDDGLKLVPELFSVPADKVNAEYLHPHSQDRVVKGKLPFMWAHSLYIIGRLLQEKFLAPGELDPLNRRLCFEKKPDVVVQVVVLAEDVNIQEKLRAYEFNVQTIAEVAPIEVQPARVLSQIYTYLGQSKKLQLSGRKSRDVGILGTSKLYTLQDRIFAFTPQFADQHRFYVASDTELVIDIFKSDVAFLKSSWLMLGRPLVVIPMTQALLDDDKIPNAILSTMKKLRSGYIGGTRVSLGKLEDFLSTSCVTNLSFLFNHEEGHPDVLYPGIRQFMDAEARRSFDQNRLRPGSKGKELNRQRSTMLRRRKSSVMGMIKRSRTIHLSDEDSNIGISTTPDSLTRSPSPDGAEGFDEDWLPRRKLGTHVSQYENVDIGELLSTLRETDNLDEQGDILQYFVYCKGLNWDTGINERSKVTVKDLLKSLYDKACSEKHWALVRHIAGILRKSVEDLAKAVTDLLVRQKQITVGLPPYNEKTITRPLPTSELRKLIHQVYGDDESSAMLTQELLVYLAMFIRTESELFHEMLRLRLGLIIQVMATELGHSLKCPGEIALEHLLNLSPFEMKNLLHHIIGGKEFGVRSAHSGNLSVISSKSSKVSKRAHLNLGPMFMSTGNFEPPGTETTRQGQWLRRRKLDGALNRVPLGFYPKVWKLLERTYGLQLAGKLIPHTLTQEMTAGELKFALQVETVLNAVPLPEYRQLVVEALMVLALIAENDAVSHLGRVVEVENLVHKANAIFLEDQRKFKGDATLCCASIIVGQNSTCSGACGICQHFYDSAPSGCYGTMTYLIRASANTLDCLPKSGEMECTVS